VVTTEGDEVELAGVLAAFEAQWHGWILAVVWESGSSFARMPTHAMRPHEWGTRGMGGMYGPPATIVTVGLLLAHPKC